MIKITVLHNSDFLKKKLAKPWIIATSKEFVSTTISVDLKIITESN